MTEQPRQPAGGPHGGQFAETVRPEADGVHLTPVPQGSFLHPPFLHTPAEAIAFWEHAEIPDEVCMAVSSHFVAYRQTIIDNYPKWKWDNFEKRDRLDGDSEGGTSDADRDAYIAEYTERLNTLPEFLDPRDARALAKAIGLSGTSQTVSDRDTGVACLDHVIETTRGAKSVRDLRAEFGIIYFERQVRDPAKYRPTPQLTIDDIVELLGERDAIFKRHVNEATERVNETAAQGSIAILNVLERM